MRKLIVTAVSGLMVLSIASAAAADVYMIGSHGSNNTRPPAAQAR